MVAKFKQFARLVAHYSKMDAQWFMQDTRYCLIVMASDLVCNIASVMSIFLLSLRFDGVGDFSSDEILFMLALYTLSAGLKLLLFGNNNAQAISRRVGRGQLDHCLIQPVPLWMQFFSEGVAPVSGCNVIITGIALYGVAVARLHIGLTLPFVLLTTLYMICSVAVQMGINYISSYLAFINPAGGEEASAMTGNMLVSLGYYPLSALPTAAKVFFTTILPAGCLAWLPSVLLLGKTPTASIYFLYPLFAVLLCGAGAMVFKKGMKHYAQSGSQRYSSMAHRS